MTAAGSLRSIKAKAELLDPSRYGRSDRSPLARWFWEIDRVLLLLVAILIGIGLIAVAAASPARRGSSAPSGKPPAPAPPLRHWSPCCR